jgi:hypothetical protein
MVNLSPAASPGRMEVGSAEASAAFDAHAGAQITPAPAAAHDVVTDGSLSLQALLSQFRHCIDDPLLPLPDPLVVRRRLFQVVRPLARRCRWLAAKGTGVSAVKRAQRMLMHKLGVCRAEEQLSASQLEEYAAIFASPLGPLQVSAIASLFGLDCGAGGDNELVDEAAI